jgi:peptidoglycan/LPS O-acetylase OafA/YrhL
VLSGYLISGSIFRMVERNTWNWKLYLTHRLVRLWIVLVPALLLGAALDLSGIRLNLAPALYAGMTGTHMLGNIPASLNLKTFAGNLFFLQGILTPTLGSNTPMWSLANEFWYYLLFPCAFFGLRKGSPVASRVVCAIVFVAAFWFVGLSIRVMFPIWLLGTLLAVVPAPRIRPALIPAAGIVYGFVLFFLAKGAESPASPRTISSGWRHFCFSGCCCRRKRRLRTGHGSGHRGRAHAFPTPCTWSTCRSWCWFSRRWPRGRAGSRPRHIWPLRFWC